MTRSFRTKPRAVKDPALRYTRRRGGRAAHAPRRRFEGFRCMAEDDDKTRILRGPLDEDVPTRILSGPSGPRAVEKDDDAERTLVLSKAPAVVAKPGVVVAPPGKPGDRIVFQCPNGHRIIVGKQFAGKRGKCNKCGADVQIPLASGQAPSPVGMIGPPPNKEPEAESSEESSSETDEQPSLDQLAFGDLASKPPAAIDDLGDLGIESDSEPEPQDDAEGWNFPAASVSSTAASHGWSASGNIPSFEADDGNPTAQLVARLWGEREHGGIVELHLQGGAILLPEWYESKWSKGTHGLFASQAPDGSVTLTAVAWESVEKVVVMQLAAVPDDMFT
jgi:hypothetical protein